jgi:histone deacetylase complex regulatory component SIN3
MGLWVQLFLGSFGEAWRELLKKENKKSLWKIYVNFIQKEKKWSSFKILPHK